MRVFFFMSLAYMSYYYIIDIFLYGRKLFNLFRSLDIFVIRYMSMAINTRESKIMESGVSCRAQSVPIEDKNIG